MQIELTDVKSNWLLETQSVDDRRPVSNNYRECLWCNYSITVEWKPFDDKAALIWRQPKPRACAQWSNVLASQQAVIGPIILLTFNEYLISSADRNLAKSAKLKHEERAHNKKIRKKTYIRCFLFRIVEPFSRTRRVGSLQVWWGPLP